MKIQNVRMLSWNILLATLSIILLGSCNAPTAGIFYSLANEVKIDKKQNGIPTDVTTKQFVGYNNMYLVISGTRLFVVDKGTNGVPASAWQQTSAPGDKQACIAIAVSDTAVYGIFTSDTDTNPTLYRTTFSSAGGATGASWSAMSGLPHSPDRIFGLPTAGTDRILVQTVDDISVLSSNHNVYLIDSGAIVPTAINFDHVYNEPAVRTGTDLQNLPGSYALLSVAVDGTHVWATSAFDVYHTTTAALSAFTWVAFPTSGPGNGKNTSLTVNLTSNRLYLTTSDGWVCTAASNLGTTTPSWRNATLSGYSFSCITPINLADTSAASLTLVPGEHLLVGTNNSKGLAIVTDDGTSTGLSILGNTSDNSWLYYGTYDSIGMSSKSITSVFWSGTATEPVFVTTTKLGLWSALYYSSINKDGINKSGLIFTWE